MPSTVITVLLTRVRTTHSCSHATLGSVGRGLEIEAPGTWEIGRVPLPQREPLSAMTGGGRRERGSERRAGAVPQPTTTSSTGYPICSLGGRSTRASAMVNGPRRPTNINMTTMSLPGALSSGVIPIDRPTVPKAEMASKASGACRGARR